ncbi:hypothetical protein PCANC_10101 [Puccinia coronata f. sp. avenae]|uniref:Uncharacterized protein n=1 Tax=Puccinia coronata f. sp. avenae TaxID=200324 RepID=A0A2N5V7A2_9BASI|nr:hypothetical protein PCASD_05162 [Puccinia coronata f. sp. avenae]PLW45862.1 hypothetical protein PCANC_10101 [Puccinia coronata f. sp. avenae]
MSMNIVYSNNKNSSTEFPRNSYEQHELSQQLSLHGDHNGSEDLEEANYRLLFGPPTTSDQPANDITMINLTPAVIAGDDEDTDQICTDLQTKFNLDPKHLKIALLASKCSPAARHANLVFSNAAYHQLGETKIPASSAYVYNERFREFVRMKAWMFLLIPGLEAYSNNPHKNGALAKTLYYLSLDAVDKQPNDWKEDHLPSSQIQEDPAALDAYRTLMGTLLKYQCSHLRELASRI